MLLAPFNIVKLLKKVVFRKDNLYSSIIAVPPDFEDLFIERAYQYAKIGLAVYKISADLSKKYGHSNENLSKLESC